MKKVFVSGTYDVLHAGHVQFFKDAKALGDHLTVCFASDEVMKLYKHRASALPEDNKHFILSNIGCIDKVVMSSNLEVPFDFRTHILSDVYHILAVTEDDKNAEIKKQFCAEHGLELVILPKKPATQSQTSTTAIRAKIKNIIDVPVRVDFAGGWLDVPKFAKQGAYIVNCTVTPKVSLNHWPYEKGAGLGDSAAHAILEAKGGISSEIKLGAGWQDPAVIAETGLCVWRSGTLPELEVKYNPDWLSGRMLILWRGKHHVANDYVDSERNFEAIAQAGLTAYEAVSQKDITKLGWAILKSYAVQLGEGMNPLPKIDRSIGQKYLGAGHGGYALYLFENKQDRDRALEDHKDSKPIEPYLKKGMDLLGD